MMTEKEFYEWQSRTAHALRKYHAPAVTDYELYKKGCADGFIDGQASVDRVVNVVKPPPDPPAKSLAKARESHKSQLNPKRKK